VHNYANELVGKREGEGGRKSGWKSGLHVAHRENFRCGSVRESEEQAKQYIHTHIIIIVYTVSRGFFRVFRYFGKGLKVK